MHPRLSTTRTRLWSPAARTGRTWLSRAVGVMWVRAHRPLRMPVGHPGCWSGGSSSAARHLRSPAAGEKVRAAGDGHLPAHGEVVYNLGPPSAFLKAGVKLALYGAVIQWFIAIISFIPGEGRVDRNASQKVQCNLLWKINHRKTDRTIFSVGLLTIYSLFYICMLNAVHWKGFECILGLTSSWCGVGGMEPCESKTQAIKMQWSPCCRWSL